MCGTFPTFAHRQLFSDFSKKVYRKVLYNQHRFLLFVTANNCTILELKPVFSQRIGYRPPTANNCTILELKPNRNIKVEKQFKLIIVPYWN